MENGWTSRCKRRPARRAPRSVARRGPGSVAGIGVGGKDGLFVVAALGEVEPVTRRGEAKSAGHFVPPSYSGFRRRKISLIFEKNARWSLKIRTTMAASHLLSGSYPQSGPPRRWRGFLAVARFPRRGEAKSAGVLFLVGAAPWVRERSRGGEH